MRVPAGTIDEPTRAYIAGLFDGEGCVMFRAVRQRGSVFYQLVVQITQRDPQVLHWLQSTLGFGHVVVKRKTACRLRPGSRPCYDWRASSASARVFLEVIRPYLRIKALQVAEKMALDRAHVRPHADKAA